MSVFRLTTGWALFFLLAVYYILNRFPGLAFIDSGELALCSYTLGVPHPTGYPLYLILSAPSTLFFERAITAVTVFSGLLTALAGIVFFNMIITIFRHFFPDRINGIIIAFPVTLILFISPVVAAQGVTNEVYGTALLVNLAVIFAALKILVTDESKVRKKCLILSWYMAGLALCNHMSSIQLLPGLAMFTVWALRGNAYVKMILTSAVAFVVPLTLYAVLPLRAAADPIPAANWGEVANWENFLRHISGWQFQIWMFTGEFTEVWINFKNFLNILAGQFPVVILPLAPIGIYYLYRRVPLFLWFLLISMVINIGLGINYSIPDIDSYYLLTIASIMIMAVAGLYFLSSLVKPRFIIPVIALGLLIWQIAGVWSENRKTDYSLPEDYVLNIGRSAEYGAIIMSEMWDHHGQLYYLQQAEQFRPDLKLIDKELLRRSWYYKTIQNAYPDLYNKIADLVPPFLDEIAVFESGGDYDPQKLEYYFQSIINRLLIDCGPAYIDHQLKYTPRGDHYLRPQGLLYRVDTVAINVNLPQPELLWQGRPLAEYSDWRALHHIDMIKVMERYR
jgi:hypothetical protein